VLKYHVDLSLLGKIGHVDIVVDTREDEYEIQMNAEARGIISGLGPAKNFTFVSRGEIVDGRFISDSFEKTVDSGKKRTSEIYLFDHKEKKVILFKEKSKHKTDGFSDVSKIGEKEQPKYVYSRETKTLDHYSDYDTLSFLCEFAAFLRQR